MASALKSPWTLAANHFFMTVATTLGTGVLALPVKLATAGLGPLTVVLTVVLLAQLAAALMTVELVQRASHDGAALDGLGGSESPVNLHTLSRLYLRPADARLFTFSVVLHLASILVSYLLAGSIALGSLFGFDPGSYGWLLAPYAFFLTLSLLRFSKALSRVVSLLTATKMLLILVMMGTAASVIGATGAAPTSSWEGDSLLHPFLIATVALGGVVNVMPLMAAAIPRNGAWAGREGRRRGTGALGEAEVLRADASSSPVLLAATRYKAAMRSFAASVCAGLLVCWALNIAWAALVLNIVPQTQDAAVAAGLPPALSLQSAARLGQISTVPLVAIIRLRHPSYGWVADSVSVFMALSITVSYLVMGAGLKHLVDGVAAHWASDVPSGGRGLRDPSPLILRPANRMAGTVAATLNTAGRALSVKSGAMATTGGASGGRIQGSVKEEETSLLADQSTLAGGGAGRLASEIAAAGVLARMADDEARLSLYLQDAEEEDGAEAGMRLDDMSHSDGVEGHVDSSKSQPVAVQASALHTALVRTVEAWDLVLARTRMLAHLPFLPLLAAVREMQACTTRRAPWLAKESGMRVMLYGVSFGGCYAIAQGQPHGFLGALEVFTSAALNLSCGVFVATMYANARRMADGRDKLPALMEGGEDNGLMENVQDASAKVPSLEPDKAGLQDPPAEEEGEVERIPDRGTPRARPSVCRSLDMHSPPYSPGVMLEGEEGPVWRLSVAAAAALPAVAWATFGAAIGYDVVETLAHGLGWQSSLWVAVLVSCGLGHGRMASALRVGFRRIGCLPQRSGDAGKSYSLGRVPDGRWACLLWALSLALLCLAGRAAGSDAWSLHGQSDPRGAVMIAYGSAACLTWVQRAVIRQPRACLFVSCLATTCAILAALLISLTHWQAPSPAENAWTGMAATAAWVAGLDQVVNVLKAGALSTA